MAQRRLLVAQRSADCSLRLAALPVGGINALKAMPRAVQKDPRGFRTARRPHCAGRKNIIFQRRHIYRQTCRRLSVSTCVDHPTITATKS